MEEPQRVLCWDDSSQLLIFIPLSKKEVDEMIYSGCPEISNRKPASEASDENCDILPWVWAVLPSRVSRLEAELSSILILLFSWS